MPDANIPNQIPQGADQPDARLTFIGQELTALKSQCA
jgi:hypothetical protein